MPRYQVGRNTRVTMTPYESGRPVELAIPVQFEGDVIKTSSVYVTDVGRKVVFLECIIDVNDPQFHQGQVVSLDITHGDDGLEPLHIGKGILDVVCHDSHFKSAVKCVLVVIELPSI